MPSIQTPSYEQGQAPRPVRLAEAGSSAAATSDGSTAVEIMGAPIAKQVRTSVLITYFNDDDIEHSFILGLKIDATTTWFHEETLAAGKSGLYEGEIKLDDTTKSIVGKLGQGKNTTNPTFTGHYRDES